LEGAEAAGAGRSGGGGTLAAGVAARAGGHRCVHARPNNLTLILPSAGVVISFPYNA